MDLALFDFDGTITTSGTYPGFVRRSVRRSRKVVGAVLLSPVILAYRVGLVSDRVVRAAISRVVFWREEPGRIAELGAQYAADTLPTMLRP